MALTPKQQRFVEEYCANGFNATQAAIKAGYSEKTAKDIACENLAKPNIKEAIDAYKEKVSEKALCTTEMVVRMLLDEAQGLGEDTTASARVSAMKALAEFTGGFDANKHKHEVVQVTHEQWIESLR